MPLASIVPLSDGRSLGYDDVGDPHGVPVLFVHGAPDSRRARHPDDGIAGDLGVWIAAYQSQAAAPGPAFYLGLAVAIAQAVWHWTLIRGRTRDGCFKAFRLNHWVGFSVFAGIAMDYALR